MMRKVVDHDDATLFATHLRTSLNVLKAYKCALDLLFADSPRISSDNNRQAVEQIKLSQQGRLKLSPALVFTKHFKPRQSLAEIGIANLPLRARVSAKSLDLRKQPLAKRFNYFSDVWTVPTRDQPAILRHEVHKTTKSELHCFEIGVDVSVVEFDVVDDRELRQVVHELRTFIEVSCVVLVCFDD